MSWSRLRRAVLAAVLAAALAVSAPLSGHAGASTPIMPDHTIVFPVVGEVRWTDTWGAPRSGGRTHAGQDLMGHKMQELVATDDGRITYLKYGGTLAGHMLELTANDGWVYTYIHLNNDTPGTDDGLAQEKDVFGPGIAVGAHVSAGQLLGYLGDSGNAESTAPHLHFEMETPDGITVNPGAALLQARHVAVAGGSNIPESKLPRLAGPDRVGTAVALSQRGWPTGAPDVVLAPGDRYDEALPASVLAASKNAPLLLTLGTGLPVAVADEVRRLGAARVTIVGSVPAAVEQALLVDGRTVTRLGVQDDAVRTAVGVAHAVGGGSGVAVLVNRTRFADGVTASAIAAGRGWPVLLSNAETVPQLSVDAWRALGVQKLVIVGGTSVVNQRIEDFVRTGGRCAPSAGCAVERLAGADRYATSVAVAQRSVAIGGRSMGTVLLGTGGAYPDVLASGPLAARVGGVSLLVDGTGAGADAATRGFLAATSAAVGDVAILGGTSAVTNVAAHKIDVALGR